MNLQLSIIVPVYNVEKYLHRCMESLLAQNIPDYEIILVDDGSKDRSPEICDKYAQEYSFVSVIHKKNEGLGFARNSGLAMAKGKYVSFIDSDDSVTPEHFCELLRTAEKYHADACLGGMTDKYETHEVVSYHPFAGKVFNKREIMDMMLPSMVGYDECGHNYSGMSVCSGIFNREIIERNSIYFCSERTYISEDVIFDIEFMSHCNIVAIVESAGYNYYHNVGTLTTKYRPERFEQIKKLYLYEIQIIADKDNYANLCRRIESMFLANLRVAIMQEVNYRGLDWKKSNKAIESMICDECVQTVIKNYDFSKLPVKQKLFCQAIYNKNNLLTYALAALQNWKKKRELFH